MNIRCKRLIEKIFMVIITMMIVALVFMCMLVGYGVYNYQNYTHLCTKVRVGMYESDVYRTLGEPIEIWTESNKFTPGERGPFRRYPNIPLKYKVLLYETPIANAFTRKRVFVYIDHHERVYTLVYVTADISD